MRLFDEPPPRFFRFRRDFAFAAAARRFAADTFPPPPPIPFVFADADAAAVTMLSPLIFASVTPAPQPFATMRYCLRCGFSPPTLMIFAMIAPRRRRRVATPSFALSVMPRYTPFRGCQRAFSCAFAALIRRCAAAALIDDIFASAISALPRTAAAGAAAHFQPRRCRHAAFAMPRCAAAMLLSPFILISIVRYALSSMRYFARARYLRHDAPCRLPLYIFSFELPCRYAFAELDILIFAELLATRLPFRQRLRQAAMLAAASELPPMRHGRE